MNPQKLTKNQIEAIRDFPEWGVWLPLDYCCKLSGYTEAKILTRARKGLVNIYKAPGCQSLYNIMDIGSLFKVSPKVETLEIENFL